MVIFLPRDTRISEAGQGFSSLGEAVGSLTGGLIANKVSQVKARNAFESFGVDPIQADKLSRLPFQQRNKMLSDVAERKGYTEAQQGLQPKTMQNLGALKAMQMMQQPSMQSQPAMQPQQVRAPGVMNPLYAGQQAQQGVNAFQQAQATGQPGQQYQAAMGGLNALKQADLAQRLGYAAPNVQQQQQQQTAQRQPGQFPSAATPTGQPVQLPSEGRTFKAPVDESAIPDEYRNLNLTPYKKPNLLTGPKRTQAQLKAEEKAHYENQIKAKTNISKAQKEKVDKIYDKADFVEKNNLVNNLRDLQKINNRIESTSTEGWFTTRKGTPETELAKDIVQSLPTNLKAHLSIELNPKVRGQRINALLKEYEQDLKRRNALEEIIDRNKGWVPENVTEKVERLARSNKEPVQQRKFNERTEESQAPENVEETENLTNAPQYAQPEETNLAAQAVAPAVRALESVGGIPGALESFVPEGPLNPERGQQVRRWAKEHNMENDPAIQARIKELEQPRERVFPTSEELREKTKEYTGQLFEPTGKKSELYQDVGSLALQIFSPIKGQGIKDAAYRAVSGAIGGIGTREALKSFDASPEVQAVGQFLGTVVGAGGAIEAVKNTTSKLYKNATNAAKELTKAQQLVDVRPLRHRIENLWKPIENKDIPGIKWLSERVAGLKPLTAGSTNTIENLVEGKRNLGKFYKEVPDGIKDKFDNLYNILRDEIIKFGNKHPSWGESFVPAEKIESAVHQALKYGKTVENNKVLKNLTRSIKGQIARMGITEANDLKNLLSDPEIRKIYGQYYARAVAGNANEAIKYARRLEKKLKERSELV